MLGENEPSTRKRVAACLIQLHWRFQFKLCCPAYRDEHWRAIDAGDIGRTLFGLRLTSSTDFTLPRLRTKFGERAFSHAGPCSPIVNALPEDLRAVRYRRVVSFFSRDLFYPTVR